MPASPALIDAAFELTLRDLLRVLAPHATLLADLGPRVVRLRAGEALVDTGGDDLVPPDEWLEQGELAWLTRDGALLGLLWNEQGAVPASAVEMLTLLLAATRREGVGREADMLITQLPTPTAWLGADLTFRRVSRTFLGAFGLTEGEVLGRTVQSVFAERFLWQRQLEAAAAGRSVQLSDEAFVPGSVAPLPPEQPGETPRWLRGEAKPYFGGAAAGVLWTVQDVTGEHVRRAEVEALLGTELPLALLTPMGTVTAASRGLSALLGEGGEGGGSGSVGGSPAAGSAGPGHPGTPLHSWSCFAPEGARTMQDLVDQALAGRRASAEVALARGGGLRLTARPVAGGARGLLIEGVASEAGGPDQGPTASQLRRLSEAATVLLDHQGRIQHVSEQVAHLLGIDVTPLTGLLLARAAQQLGLRLHTPSGRALEVPELRTLEPPAEREVLLLLPGGVSRQLGVRLSSVEPSGGRKAGMLLTLRDVTALRRTQAKLRHDASHDALTGLLNRPGLRAVLAGERQAEQFSLLYQPAVSLKDGRVLGAEALLRWTHPELGNVSPARFLPIASRSDLITAIGEWVVREAGRGRAQVREATRQRDWRTSVNLSLEELRREGALERLLPLTTRGGALDVEVSAGSLIDHSAETLGLLEGLRARGARLLVDDFGDGASSLTALTRFPLSGVKLHPTLTARLPGDPKSLTLVQGTVDLAHSLGLSVTAVGVETYAQLDVLRDLGCDAAQGYALTPPLSAGDLIQWLRSR